MELIILLVVIFGGAWVVIFTVFGVKLTKKGDGVGLILLFLGLGLLGIVIWYVLNSEYKKSEAVIPIENNTLKVCAQCVLLITGEDIARSNGKYYHLKCLLDKSENKEVS